MLMPFNLRKEEFAACETYDGRAMAEMDGWCRSACEYAGIPRAKLPAPNFAPNEQLADVHVSDLWNVRINLPEHTEPDSFSQQ